MNRWTLAVVSTLALALAGCGGDKKASNSEGAKGSIEVVSFQGGYGIDQFEKAAQGWEEATGGEATVTGNPRVWEQLKPRFVKGDVPDVTWPGWGMDTWGLIYDGQLLDLNPALDSPPFGATEGKWRDSFDPQLLKLGQYEGKQYMLPYHVNINGWWYNKKLFDQHGWKVPTTFDELLALNDQIKAKGIAPLTFQGQYPYYALYGFVYSWAIAGGGDAMWKACVNLEPGAWNNPHIVRAAQMVATLRDRGDFLKGSLGLDHTTSQLEFLKGKAAMIPCGTWLYSEMANVMPEGTQIEFMLPPFVAGGVGDPSAVMVSIEPWMVPAKAKNPQGGIDFYKYLTTPERAREFVEAKGTLMAIKVAEGVKYPPHLVRPAEIFESSTYKWQAEFRSWYPRFSKAAEDAMAALIDGKMSPQQFADALEKAAGATRDDPQVVKHKVE